MLEILVGRKVLVAAALSAAMVASLGCSRPDPVTEKQSALTVPVPPITQFAVFASRNMSFDDRTRVTSGSVGVQPGATNTLTAGIDTHISEGQVMLSPRVVLRDRASTGEIGTNSFTPGAGNVTGPVSAYVAPPPQPTPGTITPGTAAVTVPLNGTRTLAPGAYGAVLLNNNATLTLSGGLYQFTSLTVNVEARVTVLAATTVRVSGNVTGLDRSRFLPTGAVNASGFRLIVGGATNAVTLGNDVQMNALLVARGDVRVGDRYIFNGAIAGRDVIIGHDCRINFAAGTGFQCANNANCNDNNTCTTDVCGDAICTHTSLANGTACNDGNACTRTDRCSNAVCVGSNPVTCVALDQCHDPGVCAPATGLCSNPNKPNGTTCSDNNACTAPDACSAGVCVGQPIVNCGACALGDTDHDGVNDCTDGCPRDPLKTTRGICPCGVADTDSDGDGVPNCIEGQCSNDPSLQKRGVCGGCGTAFAAAGTRCDDGPCRGNFTCDGSGHCGSASLCPQPQGNNACVSKSFNNKTYWFCPGPVSWPGARAGCGNLQGQLVQIDSESENAFVNANRNAARVWIGGNDRAVVGTWRWANAASESGDRFWTEGASGRSYFARYTNWAPGSPDPTSPMCASMSGLTWVAGSCDTNAGFVCETSDDRTFTTATDPGDPCEVLGMPCVRPRPFVCTITEEDLFGNLDEIGFHNAVHACEDACRDDNTSPECAAACQSPIDAPPPNSHCPPFDADSLEACALDTVVSPIRACHDNADCNPGELCGIFKQCAQGQTQNCPAMKAENDPDETDANMVCGIAAAGCATNETGLFPDQCNEVDVCNIDHEQTVEGFSDESILTHDEIDPETTFPMPDRPSVTDPYPNRGDPCPNANCAFPADVPAHPWCKLGLEDSLALRPAQNPAKSGRAGGGKVNFNFDPRLDLTHEMSMGPLGVPNINVRAEAGLFAEVIIAPEIKGGARVPILDANAVLKASRCGVDSDDMRLRVLDLDFMPIVSRAAGNSFPFSVPSEAERTACERAYTDFAIAGDRAKKALRDAMELLRQYNRGLATPDPNDNLTNNICGQLLGNGPPRGFPPGDCTTDSPEDTINRFIEYYRRTVVGFGGFQGATGLAEAANVLRGSAFQRTEQPITIYAFHKNEEVTIFQSQFLIGPIPISLELLATMDYGATITGQLDFHPADAIIDAAQLNRPNARQALAFVKVDGKPTAGAGMALFAGVGFSVNGFTAKLGIEGRIHLGDVFIDAHAGSGVGLGTEIDDRAPPEDFTNLTGNNLIPPKRLVADLQFSAGLGAGVRDVLSGDIAIKLKLKVAFFSKSWRKRIFSFKGFCARPEAPHNEDFVGAPCDATLVSAVGNSDAAGGSYPWAALRSEMPFPELQPLTPRAAPTGIAFVSFDRVQQFFYDNLCTCINNNNPDETRTCFRNDDCCPATPVCFTDPANPGPGPRCSQCRARAQTCRPENQDRDCCSGQLCVPDILRPGLSICAGRGDCNQGCTNDTQCQQDLTCQNGICFGSDRCLPG